MHTTYPSRLQVEGRFSNGSSMVWWSCTAQKMLHFPNESFNVLGYLAANPFKLQAPSRTSAATPSYLLGPCATVSLPRITWAQISIALLSFIILYVFILISLWCLKKIQDKTALHLQCCQVCWHMLASLSWKNATCLAHPQVYSSPFKSSQSFTRRPSKKIQALY